MLLCRATTADMRRKGLQYSSSSNSNIIRGVAIYLELLKKTTHRNASQIFLLVNT
jgi:hypothetical protein